MKPVMPVYQGKKPLTRETQEVIYAKDQPEYMQLPALRTADGTVATRWRLTWKERLQAIFGGDLFLVMLTYNHPLQPVRLTFEEKDLLWIDN